MKINYSPHYFFYSFILVFILSIFRYNIDVPPLEMEAAMNIESRWRRLYCDSRTRDLRLVDTKSKIKIVIFFCGMILS